jgi:hypothetical protein
MRALCLQLLGVVVLATSFGVQSARAEDAPSASARQEAGVRFQRGVRLYEDQDYTAALAEFQAAYRVVNGTRFEVLFNIGVTQKKLFRYGEAVRTLRQYLQRGGDKIPADRKDLVERELSEIKALVAEVTVQVDGLPANIEVDGEVVAQTPLTEPLLLRSGRHTIIAKREGFEDESRQVDVVSSSKVNVSMRMREKIEVSTEAKLTVRSKPSGADISLDGKHVGQDPWTGSVTPGGHEVIGLLSGYQKARLEVLLNPAQERELLLELIPIPKKKPIYKRASFWVPVVIGALAVAGGITAAVILTRSEPDVTISAYSH